MGGVLSQDHYPDPKRSGPIKIKVYVTHNRLNVILYTGDITEVGADGIVTADRCGMPGPSKVTQALLKKGNISYECLKTIVQNIHHTLALKSGEVYCLHTHNYQIELQFKVILLAIVLPFDESPDHHTWKIHTEQLYRKILDEADKYGLTSIAIPLLGSGNARASTELAVEALIAALSQYKGNLHLTTVILVTLSDTVLNEITKQWEDYYSQAYTNPPRFVEQRIPSATGDERYQRGYEYNTNVNERERNRYDTPRNNNESKKSSDSVSDFVVVNSETSHTAQNTLLYQACGNMPAIENQPQSQSQISMNQSTLPNGMPSNYIKNPITGHDHDFETTHSASTHTYDEQPRDACAPVQQRYQSGDTKLDKQHAKNGTFPSEDFNIKHHEVNIDSQFTSEDFNIKHPEVNIDSQFRANQLPCYDITGNQPPGKMTDKVIRDVSVPGYDGHGVIVVDYYFEDGIQTEGHPHPGKPYNGTRRRGFLPDNEEGRAVLRLLRKSFDRKLTFRINESPTTGNDSVTWSDIEHKTNTHGGTPRNGYPDDAYMNRVRNDLARKGITEDSSSRTDQLENHDMTVLNEQNETMKQKSKEENEEQQKLKEENEELQKLKEEQKSKEENEELQKLKEENEELQKLKEEQKSKEENEELQKLKEELQKSKEESEELQKLKEELERVNEELQKLKEENEELQKLKEELQKSKEENEELQKLKEELQKVKEENAELQKLKEENEELQKLKEENEELQKFKEENEELQNVKEENEELRKEKEEKEQQLKEEKEEQRVNKEKEELQKLKEENEEQNVKEENEELRKEKEEKEQKLKEEKEELQRVNKENEELQKLKEENEELQNVKEENEELQKLKKENEEQKLKEENDELQKVKEENEEPEIEGRK